MAEARLNPFNPEDPFPLVSADSHTHAEAYEHSTAADGWIGLRTSETESLLRGIHASEPGIHPGPQAGMIQGTRSRDLQQIWLGLPIQSLQTPYVEIRRMLHEISPSPGSRVVDLGAGYGRMAWVIARHHPGARFVGYEFVPERVAESRRCLGLHGIPANWMQAADLADPSFAPARADLYFIYDFGTRQAIAKTLDDLKRIARDQPIAVAARGRASRDEIERNQPWLSQIVPASHRGNYSIYRSG